VVLVVRAVPAPATTRVALEHRKLRVAVAVARSVDLADLADPVARSTRSLRSRGGRGGRGGRGCRSAAPATRKIPRPADLHDGDEHVRLVLPDALGSKCHVSCDDHYKLRNMVNGC
jgi:hypothetical protein